jgi:hypothetical protein
MDNNKLIFGGVIVLAAILSIGMVMGVSDSKKIDTKIKIKTKSPIHEGDKVKIKLTDDKNNPISNQTVKVTVKDEDDNSYKYSVVTNKNGVGKLKLDKGAGEYKVKCKFKGNDQYNATSKSKTITIEDESEDSGSFYSGQAEREIYTGEIHEGPDGNFYQHVGDNEWVQI